MVVPGVTPAQVTLTLSLTASQHPSSPQYFCQHPEAIEDCEATEELASTLKLLLAGVLAADSAARRLCRAWGLPDSALHDDDVVTDLLCVL